MPRPKLSIKKKEDVFNKTAFEISQTSTQKPQISTQKPKILTISNWKSAIKKFSHSQKQKNPNVKQINKSVEKSMKYLRRKLQRKNNNDLEESLFGKTMGSNSSFIKPKVDEDRNSADRSFSNFFVIKKLNVGRTGQEDHDRNSAREENLEKSGKIEKRIFAEKYKDVIRDDEVDYSDRGSENFRRQKLAVADFWGDFNPFSEEKVALGEELRNDVVKETNITIKDPSFEFSKQVLTKDVLDLDKSEYDKLASKNPRSPKSVNKHVEDELVRSENRGSPKPIKKSYKFFNYRDRERVPERIKTEANVEDSQNMTLSSDSLNETKIWKKTNQIKQNDKDLMQIQPWEKIWHLKNFLQNVEKQDLSHQSPEYLLEFRFLANLLYSKTSWIK